MSHYLIAGMTESGKTTLAIALSREFRRKRHSVAVLDPMHDLRWSYDFMTHKAEVFAPFVWSHKKLWVFIDEAGAFGKFSDLTTGLMTRGRHLGHSVTLLTQNLTQVSPLIRGQASVVYLFACTDEETKLVASTFRQPSLLTMPPLPKGDFYKVSRFAEIEKYTIDFRTGRVIGKK